MDTSALHLRITTEGMPEAQRGLTGVENAASMVEGAVKKMAAAFALFKAGGFISDLTQLAARYDTLGVVMRVVGNNAGYTGAQMEQFAQGLQKQGISMVESRNTLSMMAGAHIDLANATKLGRVAQDAAVIGNLNSSEAFQRMIYGIQSGQVEVLRTIGLNVNFEQSYKKLAATLGKSVQDLTDLEKVTARTNIVMEKGKDIAGAYEESLGTVGKAAKSMERIWENLEVLMGNVFQEGFIVMVDGMTAAMKTATEWAEKNGKALGELSKSIKDVMVSGEQFVKMLTVISGGSEGASNGVGFLTRIFQGVALIIAATTDALQAFWGELSGFIGDLIIKVGRVVDLMTALAGFTGKGGISQFGESVSAYGNGITNRLNNGTATGAVLDSMMPSHGTAASTSSSEAARIAAGEKRRAQEALDAAKMASDVYTNTKARGPQEDAGFMYFSLQPRIVNDIEQVTTAAAEYAQAMKGFDANIKKFMQDNVTTWEIIEKVVTHSSQVASDAMVSWMDNLDGLGRSWRTLGDTVKSVIRDMIIQMQRAIIQQQLMDPLLKWGLAAVGGMLNPAANTGPGSAPTGMNYAGTLANSGGSEISPSIVVNVSGGGSEASVSGGAAAGVDLGKMIQATCDQWAIKNSRQGGLLARS